MPDTFSAGSTGSRGSTVAANLSRGIWTVAGPLCPKLRQIRPGIDPSLMPVAEHQLQPVTLSVNLQQANRVGDHGLHAPQPKRAALGARAKLPELNMTDVLLTAVLPAQAQQLSVPGVSDRTRRRHHGSCPNAMRTALRTSGSPSCSSCSNAGRARLSPNSPSAKAASLRRLLMLWVKVSTSDQSAG